MQHRVESAPSHNHRMADRERFEPFQVRRQVPRQLQPTSYYAGALGQRRDQDDFSSD
jgi:hypothetical protein